MPEDLFLRELLCDEMGEGKNSKKKCQWEENLVKS